MPDEVKVSKCPICGGLWAEGECYKCGAYLEDGKVVVPPKSAGPPETKPATQPVHIPPQKRAWDEP